MKLFFFILILFFSQASFGQFTIDTSLHAEYWNVFERLPEKYKKEKNTHFKKGLGLLTSIKADTLNKNEFLGNHPLEKDPNAVETVKNDPKVFSQSEKESISEVQPMWLSCNCRFKGDTLEIVSGISIFSGFDITTSLIKDKARARYTEYESENVFKVTLTSEKVSEFSIPATINNLVLDRIPKKGIPEIYGKMTATSNGFFSYLNAGNFKNGYMHKRLRVEYYFRCDITN